MSLFNIGDTVRRLPQDQHLLSWAHGDALCVVLATPGSGIRVSVGGNEVLGCFSADRFELVARAGNPAPPPARPSAPTGRKDDSGKLDFTLLDDMPRALSAVVEVMQWAITKKEPVPYDRGSWLGVEPERYNAAQRRHDVAASLQASQCTNTDRRMELDPETNLLHAAHKACSALMELELILRIKEGKQ